MAPRHRSKGNQHLEGTNIKKVPKKGGGYYYYYQMPDGTREPLAHGDEKASIEAAVILNRELRPSGGVAERILNAPPRPTNKNPLFTEVIAQFESEWLPNQNYAKRSLKEREIKLNKYREKFEHKVVGDLDTFAIATFLRELSAESARQHRVLLDQVFRFAASNGYQTARPMLEIEKRKQEKRKRARHTWDGFNAVYAAAPPWLQRAINIALYSLQRRSDLVAINAREQVSIDNKTIRILQQKSENYDKPVYIDIAMGEQLFESVMSAVKSDVHCPFLIHHRPVRITAQSRKKKLHAFAVLPDYLTRAYSEVRDKVGVYNHLPKAERPGFHSIRALGVWLYTKAGYPDEYIMALAGHANKAMKARYTEGHERPAPVRVNADLSMKGVDLSSVDWETDLSKPLKQLIESGD